MYFGKYLRQLTQLQFLAKFTLKKVDHAKIT